MYFPTRKLAFVTGFMNEIWYTCEASMWMENIFTWTGIYAVEIGHTRWFANA